MNYADSAVAVLYQHCSTAQVFKVSCRTSTRTVTPKETTRCWHACPSSRNTATTQCYPLDISKYAAITAAFRWVSFRPVFLVCISKYAAITAAFRWVSFRPVFLVCISKYAAITAAYRWVSFRPVFLVCISRDRVAGGSCFIDVKPFP